jgi:hypothetical protein
MKNLTVLSIFLIPNLIFCQSWIIGYGSEINFSKAKFSGKITNSYNGENYSYNLGINKMVTNLSWSSIKIGYLTPNSFYIGLNGSYISPLFEDGKVIKDNLWNQSIDISCSVYGNGYITHEAQASFKYKRFIGLDVAYDITQFLLPNTELSLLGGIGIYYHDKYFGEIIETYRYQ